MSGEYRAGERRASTISREEARRIAVEAAEEALKKQTDKFYTDVGRGIIQKLIWFVGLVGVAVVLYLNSRGFKP